MSRVQRVATAWMQFWFAPCSACTLAIPRALLLGGLAVYYARIDFSAWSTVDPSLWQPIWLFDRVGMGPTSPHVMSVLQNVWKVSLVLGCVGLLTRPSLVVAAALGTYLLGLPHNFGQTYHFDAVVVIALWILACSRAGDVWSLDRLLARGADPQPSGEYRWPGQAILVALSFVFFAAGVAKITTSGTAWVFSDHMQLLLLRSQYHLSDADPLVPWGNAIAAVWWMPRLMALTTIVVETAYPLALFWRPARRVMVPAAVLLIIGIRSLMGPTFEQFLLINLFWVPWDRVYVHVGAERYAPRCLEDEAIGP